jgi:hypothetical protein
MSTSIRHYACFFLLIAVLLKFHFDNCHADECCYSERHSAACHFTECHSADYKSTSCHSAARHSAEHLSSESFKYLTAMFHSSKSCSAECHFSKCYYAKFCSTVSFCRISLGCLKMIFCSQFLRRLVQFSSK